MPIENPLKCGIEGCFGYYGCPLPPNRCETCKRAEACKEYAEAHTPRKRIKLIIDLKTLTELLNQRLPNENLDDLLTRYLIKGLQASGKMSMPTRSPAVGKQISPK
jgi:hypothetical protein